MSNPFPNHFDSTCDSCGDDIFEGDLVFVIDDQFVCEDCADANDNICPECGNFKKEEYEFCFECNENMKNE